MFRCVKRFSAMHESREKELWSRWLRSLASSLIFLMAFSGVVEARGDPALRSGKYACIIENAGGFFQRNGTVLVAALALPKYKFLMDININEYLSWEGCSKALQDDMAPTCTARFQIELDQDIIKS